MLSPSEPWPPDYQSAFAYRLKMIRRVEDNPEIAKGIRRHYSTRCVEFIEEWVDTVDPRNAGVPGRRVRMPFILFQRQRDFVQFLQDCLEYEQGGLVEKSRDMGATWLCCAFSVWLWLFRTGASVGWGSRKEMLVDRIGDMDSIFEKMRDIVDHLPGWMLPEGFSRGAHLAHMKIINPQNGSSITGESGDNIGRGGRKLIYFKDESAHYERPERIEAALADNTRVPIDISSVHGLGNVFHRKREAGWDWTPDEPPPPGRTLVFVMDWRDHPAKNQEWYEGRRRTAEDEGLLHLFYQEVDRNYAASVAGILIPPEHVVSAIDAHVKLGLPMDEGGWCAALDVADNDGQGDRNAIAARKGLVLRHAREWGDRDVGVTTRRAISECEAFAPLDLQYDSVGMGSSVKAEYNRLRDERAMPPGIRLIPWSAGDGPLNPESRVVPHDNKSPLNKDFYGNLKAQGWWLLARRFEKTHRAVTRGEKFDIDELISIDGKMPLLRQVQKELSQPTGSKTTARLKLIVDKTPEGTRSPNVGDAVMMCYHPVKSGYDSSMKWV